MGWINNLRSKISLQFDPKDIMENFIAGPQLWLFPWKNPLTERLGRDFFLNLPKEPGVYLMRDRGRRVIYVGQSKNLRQRLDSYRFARPESSSRKLIRLIARVSSIEIELCPSASAARLRENVLLRQYRPPLNSVNTHPESHLFIQIKLNAEGLEVDYSNKEEDFSSRQPDIHLFGAFKSFPTRRGLQALYRLFWRHLNPTVNRHFLPLHLNRQKPPRPYRLEPISRNGRMARKILDYFSGKSDALINRLCGKSGQLLAGMNDPWLRRILEEDRDALTHFYHAGPARNKRLKVDTPLSSKRPIGQAQLDDLLAS